MQDLGGRESVGTPRRQGLSLILINLCIGGLASVDLGRLYLLCLYLTILTTRTAHRVPCATEANVELAPACELNGPFELLPLCSFVRHHPAYILSSLFVAMAIAQPSTFAHETLELIFSFCDVPTLAAVGRVSSACLELSVPFLYEHIVLSDHKTCDLFFQKSRVSRTQYLYHSDQPR